MKRRHIGMLLMVLCMIGVSSAKSILWCSGGAGDPYFDQGWVDLLEGEGYTVDRLEDAEVMTQAKVDLADTYDLVIFGRDTISDRYDDGTGAEWEVALWNSITSPMICQTGYMWRNSRWKWLNSGSTLSTSTNLAPDLVPGDTLYDILFDGVTPNETGTFDYCADQVTLAETTDVGNGVLIGHRDYDPQPWVYAAYWERGLEFYDGSGQYANGPRLALAGGYTGDSNRGALNLTADGITIFLNAVDYMYLTGKIPAHTPSPANNATGVMTATTLMWEAGLDPNDLTKVNPAIKKHYVWMSNGNPADPNLSLAETIDITNYNDPAADGTYDPIPGLTTDKVYYWMVEEGVDNGEGGVCSVGDPNNFVSPVWMFDTSTLAEITLQPVSVKADVDSTAEFYIEYSSISTVTGITWYKNGSPLPAGGDISIVWDQTSSTLSIDHVDSSDESEYYAVVTNNNDSDPTDTVYLSLKKQLAWYQFEQNVDDSIGMNNGTDIGGMNYAAGKITDGGQAYAADPNGTNYVLLTTDAYPKAGFGNGLDAFTYSCWTKLDPGEGGIVLGVFNDGSTTGLRFSINSVENDISVYMRQEGGASIQPTTSTLATDSQWHYVAVTYDASEMKIYVDGVWRTTATRTLTDFVEWQYPMVTMAVNSRGSINERFSGQVDDLKIYNYAFTSAEIAQEYLGVEGGWICDTEKPELLYDYDDNCKVDLADFAKFAATWLDSNRVYDDGI